MHDGISPYSASYKQGNGKEKGMEKEWQGSRKEGMRGEWQEKKKEMARR
jgi:hypothetical protein